MKTSNKLWIDKFIVGRFARIINILVIILGKILRIDHTINREFKTIAVCKYKGMGSIIQSTPLLFSLRNKFPNAKLIYISSKENFHILNQISIIDEIILIDDSSFLKLTKSVIPFIYKLFSRKIEVYIDLEVYSNFSTLIAILSKSVNRMGYYLNSMHYKLGNYTHMMYFNSRSTISESYLQFARLLGCETYNQLYKLNSDIQSIQISDGEQLNLVNEKYILINPNASDLRLERRWSEDSFIELITLLSNKLEDYKIVLIGSKSESDYVNKLIARLNIENKLISLAGKTDILGLIAVIKNANLFITNDTGPMHIAFSTMTTTLALFGPCSPVQYGINSNAFTIYENLYCSPCVHDFVWPPCRGNNICMKAIKVDTVFNKAMDIINNQGNDSCNNMVTESDNIKFSCIGYMKKASGPCGKTILSPSLKPLL